MPAPAITHPTQPPIATPTPTTIQTLTTTTHAGDKVFNYTYNGLCMISM